MLGAMMSKGSGNPMCLTEMLGSERYEGLESKNW
jgi:hypothetical protein